MLAGLEALVKPSEVMKSLGRIPPGDGGSAEQGQGGPESPGELDGGRQVSG